MDQGENIILVEKLKKTKIFPPKLNEFLVLALEEGALEEEVEKELDKMLSEK